MTDEKKVITLPNGTEIPEEEMEDIKQAVERQTLPSGLYGQHVEAVFVLAKRVKDELGADGVSDGFPETVFANAIAAYWNTVNIEMQRAAQNPPRGGQPGRGGGVARLH